jgi:iron complex outermembrane receptor protein
MWMNAGELKNTGVEIAITGKPIQSKNWFVELGVNAAYNKNEVVAINAGGRDMIEAGMTAGMSKAITYHKVGQPANSFWVYQQVYDETGRPVQGVYVDRDANGVIDEGDRYFYKSPTAPWTGGFYFKLSYKNWDLGTNFRASFDNYVYNDIIQDKMNSDVTYNASKAFYQNTTPSIAALKWTSYDYPLSDYFVQNASFLKCDNITLGWNFKTWDDYLSGRIYASCTNVFTITKYDGLDPEQTSGKESSPYPRARTFLVGLNLNF